MRFRSALGGPGHPKLRFRRRKKPVAKRLPMSTVTLDPSSTEAGGPTPKPLTTGKQPLGVIIALWAFVTIPFAAVVAAIPAMWGWGLSWVDAVLFVIFY